MTGPATGLPRNTAVGWNSDPDLPETQGFPLLDGTVTADVCVVGLGGSGLAAINELLGRGLDVVGVDGDTVAAGAAGRNGGFLLGGPAHMVHQAARLLGTDVALDLYRETLREIAALRDALGPAVIRPTGSVRLAGLPGDPLDDAEAVDRQAELADCDAQYEFLRAHGIAVERYDGRLGRGLYLPDDAAMNPVRRALALAEQYRGRARLFEGSPVRAVRHDSVVTERGSISCGAAIVAVDGRLDVLLPQLADRIRTARLQMLATEPVGPGLLPWPVYGRWGYDYAQQDPAGRLFVGGGRDRFIDEEWTHDDHPTDLVQNWIHELACRFAGRQVQVTHRWAASVGYTSDGRPLVTEAAPGVAACGGYSGTGNLVGPIAARAAVALLLDGTPPAPYFSS